MMNENLKVSICMITYGHEDYIREAIEGVLMQECNFEVELILANDCSPDGTDDVIQDILANYPKHSCLKYFKHQKNLGMMPNFIFALKHCTRKYVAICDGDDYWTDPLKLQKQVDFLEANPDYVMCFHQIKILKIDGTIVEDFITTVPEEHETMKDCARFGNYIHTPSVVYRNVLSELPFEFKLSPIGDYFLYMMLAEHGKIKYIKEEMAVYRHGVGILSGNDNVLQLKKWTECLVLVFSNCKNDEIKSILYERYQNGIDAIY